MFFTPIQSSLRTCSESQVRPGRVEPLLLRPAIAHSDRVISHSLRRNGNRHSHPAAPRLAGLVRPALLGHPVHHAENGTRNAPEFVRGASANECRSRSTILDSV